MYILRSNIQFYRKWQPTRSNKREKKCGNKNAAQIEFHQITVTNRVMNRILNQYLFIVVVVVVLFSSVKKRNITAYLREKNIEKNITESTEGKKCEQKNLSPIIK